MDAATVSMDTLRRAFRDIIAGHTRATILRRAAYIRHLSDIDQVGLDEKRAEYHREAKDSGLLTEEERLVQLRAAGEWSDEKELEVTRARQHVDSLREGTAKARRLMPSAVKDYLRKITEAEEAHRALEIAKRRLVGLTCEMAASEAVNDFYIATNLYADPALTQPLFPPEEFDYLRDATIAEIVRGYNAAMEGCSDHAIRKLAMQPFFQRKFQLAGDDYTTLFGKPIAVLTNAQVDLIRHGAHFRHIYTTHDVSKWKKEILEDPDLMSEYAASITAKKAELEAHGAQEAGAIVMGVKKEDAAAVGLKSGPDPMKQIMSQFGGNVMDWAAKKA